MNKSYINELVGIHNFLNTIKTINEAVNFNDENDYYGDEQGYEGMEEPEAGMQGPEQRSQQQEQPQEMPDEKGQEQEQPMKNMDPEEEGMEELDQMGEIDKIREITLSGMHKLCKNPQDPQYQALKKIFQMCDKGVDEEMKQQKGQTA